MAGYQVGVYKSLGHIKSNGKKEEILHQNWIKVTEISYCKDGDKQLEKL